MQNELRNSQEALIDKICVSGFYVLRIDDIDDLVRRDIVSIKKGQQCYLPSIGVSSIHIGATPCFDRFEYGLTPDGYVYSRMELSIPGDDGYHNLNCNYLWQYRSQIADALALLDYSYGITARIDGLRIQTIEINKTIEIDHPFTEYQRPLALMMHSFSGKLRLKERDYFQMSKHPNKAEDNERISRTFEKCSGKKGLSVKIYDKSFQLNHLQGKDKLETPVVGNYLRFELTLSSPEKVKDAFDTNRFNAITEQMIQEYFNKFIEDNVSSTFAKYKEKRFQAIRRILRRTYIPGSHTRVHDALLEIQDTEIKDHLPLLLDVNELIELLDENVIPFKGKYAAQKKNNAKLQFRKVCNEHVPTLANGDSVKYEELINKLGKGSSAP